MSRLEAALAELAEAIRAEVRAEATPVGGPDRLLDVETAGAMLSLGRSKLLAEIYSGRLASLKVGRRRLVPAAAITAYIIAGLPR